MNHPNTPSHHQPTKAHPSTDGPWKLLVTAGPTHEPIDAVRYLANKSSGRIGIAIAQQAASRSWPVTLLLGPTHLTTDHSLINTIRFQSTQDLENLLEQQLPNHDILIMAAAVADFRPTNVNPTGKLSRSQGQLNLELEPTPDLLAKCAKNRDPGQILVGFALEPEDRLLDSARHKLQAKQIDLIVANPLQTMDADTIQATILSNRGDQYKTPGQMPKTEFAPWLLDIIQNHIKESRT